MAFVNVMDHIITVWIVVLFLHLRLFVLIFDKLTTGTRPAFFSSKPELSGQLSRPQEWPLDRSLTVLQTCRL